MLSLFSEWEMTLKALAASALMELSKAEAATVCGDDEEEEGSSWLGVEALCKTELIGAELMVP